MQHIRTGQLLHPPAVAGRLLDAQDLQLVGGVQPAHIAHLFPLIDKEIADRRAQVGFAASGLSQHHKTFGELHVLSAETLDESDGALPQLRLPRDFCMKGIDPFVEQLPQT